MSEDPPKAHMPNLRYLYELICFCVRRHPVILLGTVLGLLSVVIELFAIASLLPLTVLASGRVLHEQSEWHSALAFIGMAPTVNSFLAMFSVLLTLSIIAQFCNQALVTNFGKRVQADLSSEAFTTVVRQFSLRDIEEKSIGHFISLAGDETARAGTILVLMNQLLSAGFLAGLYFAALFYFSAWVGWGVTLFLAVSFLGLLKSFQSSQQLGHKLTELRRLAYSVFLDSMNGLRSVRAFAAERYVSDQYERVIRAYTSTAARIEIASHLARTVPALLLVLGLGLATVLFSSVDPALLDLAFLITVLVLLLRFFPSAGQCLNLAYHVISESKIAKDVTQVVAPATIGSDGHEQYRVLQPHIDEIKASDLIFSHGIKPVFRSLSFRFVRGRSYAVVGPSGSGKSTLFDLLLAFYELEGGELLINGMPIQLVRPDSLREKVLLLGQQPTIFNDTVHQNICFGRQASRLEVERACGLTSLDEVIAELPRGLDTVISYQGSNLSGGQCQRIGLARALLRKPQVLLLDESTSALDRATRDKVVRSIIDEYRDRIVVFSTHDLDIARKVDEVIELSSVASTGSQEIERVGK
jgi:ABC-type multidrug transport system fused ATPase/permease subunit